jgi:uracil-DNA glycosylase
MHERQHAVLQALEIAVWTQRGVSASAPAAAKPSADSNKYLTPSPAPAAQQALQPLTSTTLATAEVGSMDWATLASAVSQCTRCGLCKSRTQTVFGIGNTAARWMIVGEAPGAEEDARGEPFVGQAGRLLDNMLAAIGIKREQVYIANVLKCRPPGNRNPEPAEVAQCAPYLQRQLELVNPQLVLLLGRFAAQSLLGTSASIASLRGKVHQINVQGQPINAVVSYHPAYLLRNLPEKAKSWADLNLARKIAVPVE